MRKQIFQRFYLRIVVPTVVSLVLFILLIFLIIMPFSKHQMLERKKEMIKELANGAVSVLNSINQQYLNGEISLEQAQKIAATIIESMRFGAQQKDYFWINDMHPFMIMHPYQPELNGADLSTYSDSQGVFLFSEAVKLVKRNGDGYVSYLWQWKDDSTKLVPKLSYVKGFEPWGWVIGTGIYIEDVNFEIAKLKKKVVVSSSIIILIAAIIIFYVLKQTLIIERENERSYEEIKKLNKDLERSFSEQSTKLKQALTELEAFAYTVSHDLRAPIRHIDGFTKLLYKHLKFPTVEVSGYYKKIEQSTFKMTHIIDELLDFAHLGRKEPNYRIVNMNNLIQTLIDELCVDNNVHKIYWVINEIPEVKGDFNLLKILFYNILHNAIKYSSKNENTQIEIGADVYESYVEYFIRDNGIGFNMQYSDKLFGVFQRLHSTEEFDGIGIGLAKVKQIALKHNGEVRAESEINKGSIFYIKLPK